MACTSCSTSDGGAPAGCGNKGNCGTDSCNKLTVFDWLSNMSLPNGEKPFDCVEVRFKNGRKEFYRNTENLTLSMGDIIATEASPGHDIGIVTLTGELVRIQMKKKGVNVESKEIGKIYRKASQKDIDIWAAAREREEPMKVRARELAIAQKLEMKISDIEFQGDGSKATFYYTANDRIDFRALIKDFAKEFSTRIEMKQVGFRQEAARLGGIGSCGRELCCSTWLTDFRSVNTSAARYQQLSLNPQKLAGQCGKLKCCLNYELDTYLDALKDIPNRIESLQTEVGVARHQKTDIFKKLMWFSYANQEDWIPLKVDRVKEIMAMNKKGEKPVNLKDEAVELKTAALVEKTHDYENVVGQDSLTRLDDKNKNRNNKNRNPRNDRKKGPAEAGSTPSSPAQRQQPQNRNQPQRTPADRPKQTPRPAQKDASVKPNETAAQKPMADGEASAAPKRNNNNRNKNRNRNNRGKDNKEQSPDKPDNV